APSVRLFRTRAPRRSAKRGGGCDSRSSPQSSRAGRVRQLSALEVELGDLGIRVDRGELREEREAVDTGAVAVAPRETEGVAPDLEEIDQLERPGGPRVGLVHPLNRPSVTLALGARAEAAEHPVGDRAPGAVGPDDLE